MDDFEILLKLLHETPEVIARFKKFWFEYSTYKERRIEDEYPENVLKDCISLILSQLEILEERMHNIIRVAERIERIKENNAK